MISDLLDTGAGRRARRELRLKMKPSTAIRGAVDGGWWPWSTDPGAEFPALIMAVSSWIGPPRRLTYNIDAWGPAKHTLSVEGWAVRLAGFHAMHANTVRLTGPNGKRICLLVVPPGTPGGVARAVLRSASGLDTIATVSEILASNGVPVTEPMVVAVP